MELTESFKTLCTMQSDTYFTGKLYPKLDALLLNSEGEIVYVGSSCQFRTMRRYKQWLCEYKNYCHGDLKIVRGKND